VSSAVQIELYVHFVSLLKMNSLSWHVFQKCTHRLPLKLDFISVNSTVAHARMSAVYLWAGWSGHNSFLPNPKFVRPPASPIKPTPIVSVPVEEEDISGITDQFGEELEQALYFERCAEEAEHYKYFERCAEELEQDLYFERCAEEAEHEKYFEWCAEELEQALYFER
jgi:hypothetical protein